MRRLNCRSQRTVSGARARNASITFAECVPGPTNYPGRLPHMLYAGSLVFTPPAAKLTVSA
jgi:hypothetical protein